MSEEKVVELYNKGASLREIAKATGLSSSRIYYILGKYGLPMRRASLKPKRESEMITYVTGPRKTGAMYLPIPKAVREKLDINYRDAFEWIITEGGDILLKKSS